MPGRCWSSRRLVSASLSGWCVAIWGCIVTTCVHAMPVLLEDKIHVYGLALAISK